MTTHYEIKILGHLWQPGVIAAATAVVREPMELPQAEGETDDDYAIRMIECATNTGDFSAVIGMEIVKVEVEDRVTVDDHEGNVRQTQVTKTYTTLQAFDEEQEMQYGDCMFPGDD